MASSDHEARTCVPSSAASMASRMVLTRSRASSSDSVTYKHCTNMVHLGWAFFRATRSRIGPACPLRSPLADSERVPEAGR